MTGSRRSVRQLRTSLHENRSRLDRDLRELEVCVEQSVNPKNILARHPALVTAAGAILGIVVVRHPAIVGRTLTRIAQASVPFLLRAVLQRGATELQQSARAAEDASA